MGDLWVPPGVERGKLASPDELDLWMGLHPFIGGAKSIPAAPPVSGYLAWYDAYHITGVSDGAALSSWPDGSTNNLAASASGTARPTFYSSTAGKTVNGLPAVWFNGTTNFMTSSSGSPSGNGTILFVANLGTINTNASIVFDGGTSSGRWEFSWNPGTGGGDYYNGIGDATWGTTAPTGGNQWTILTGTSVTVRQNGTQVATKSTASANSLSGITLGTYYAGASALAGYWFQGGLCEIIFYPSQLSSSDYTSVESYLKNKWGTP